jgi:anion-transporting  ArsA/GET3 family ATPase
MSQEAVALTTKKKNDLLYYLSKTSSSTAEKIERLEALYKSLKERASRNPLLERILNKSFTLLNIPELPALQEVERTARSLEEYSTRLHTLITTIEDALRKIDHIESSMNEIEKNRHELEKWTDVIQNLNPSLYSDAVRLLRKAEKIQQEDYNDFNDLYKRVEEIKQQLYQMYVKTRTEYNKTVSILQGEVATTQEVLAKAEVVASLQDRAKIEQSKARLKQIEEYLSKAKQDPQPIDPNAIYKELAKIKNEAQSLLNTALSELEIKVYEETLRYTNILGRKPIPLTELLEYVSRKTNMPTQEVLRTLYSLATKGLLSVKVLVQG